jgi:FMN phosphatase YigB (HAD superfamily)
MPNLIKRNEFLDEIAAKYKTELNYYTHPGVAITAHQVGALHKESWTELLIAKGVIPATKGVDKYIELERTLAALYCFQLCLDENYQDFVEAQTDNDKLNRRNFEKLCKFVKGITANENSKATIINLILKSDLGKSPAVRELAGNAGIDPRLDTDELMLAILRLNHSEIIKILPSFAAMSDASKSLLVKSYPMMLTCYGHLYFLEGGIQTLENMAAGLRTIPETERKELLSLVSVAQLFDAIGAQGQLNMNGSVTCTNNFYDGYMDVLETFNLLEAYLVMPDIEDPIDSALYVHVDDRGAKVYLYDNTFKDRTDFEVVMRLVCTLRIFDTDVAHKLKIAYDGLKPEYRELLRTQLSLERGVGINAFSHSPHYVASSAQNISRVDFESGNVELAIEKALNAEICFAMLIKELAENHAAAVNDPKYPLSFAKLAALGSDDPEKMDVTLARWALPRPVPKTKIKNLIFDLGHVFIRIDVKASPVYKAFSDLTRRAGNYIPFYEIKRLATQSHLKVVIDQYHLNQIDTPTFRTATKALLGLQSISDEEFDTAFCASILDNPESVKERLQALDKLFEEGYNIYLLSRNNEIHRLHTKQHFEGLHWGKYFFKQYYSNETGVSKPTLTAYTAVLKDNRLNAHETMFFDDIKAYIRAAWNVGIRGRQFTVDYKMSNIKIMIDAITKAEKWALTNNVKDNNSEAFITRLGTLTFFAAEKWRSRVTPKAKGSDVSVMEESSLEEKPDDDVNALERGTRLSHRP